MSKEEIAKRIEEIDAEIKAAEEELKRQDTIQHAIKLIINSIYGAFGNKWFYFYDKNLASAITIQGRDLINFSIAAINHYFINIWHKDIKSHAMLGIKTEDVTPITEKTAIYTDTDSIYINFEPLIKSIRDNQRTKEENLKFIIEFIEKRFNQYLNTAFDKYGEKYNTVNQQTFKLENISYSGIWVAKKNYVTRPVYDGEHKIMISPDKIKSKPKGITAAKPSYPKYARDKILELIDYMLEKGENTDIEGKIIPTLASYKRGFATLSVDECAPNQKVNVYSKYVKDDKVVIIPKGMPIGVRAALYHNHLIEKMNIRKYSKIKNFDTVKIYFCRDERPGYEEMDIFAYLPGDFPHEFAPKMDIDKQFYMVVIEPVNKILNAMGMQKITEGLTIEIEVEKIKSKNKMSIESAHPYRAVNSFTLEYVEVPKESCWMFDHMFFSGKQAPGQDCVREFLKYASLYGAYTKIVPNCEFDSFLKKSSKKKEIEKLKSMTDEEALATKTKMAEKLKAKKVELSSMEKEIERLKAQADAAKDVKDKTVYSSIKYKMDSIKQSMRSVKEEKKELEETIRSVFE